MYKCHICTHYNWELRDCTLTAQYEGTSELPITCQYKPMECFEEDSQPYIEGIKVWTIT